MKRFDRLKNLVGGIFLLCFLNVLTAAFGVGVFSQSAPVKPVIGDVLPKEVFPGMFLMVKGSGLYSSAGETQVIFSQGDKVIKSYFGGGGVQADGVWGETVKVPPDLRAGVCRIEVEADNVRSAPFFINVGESARPPTLTGISSAIVNPGYLVWIDGYAFSENQVLEMTDAEGQKFTKTITGVSTDNSLDFTVPPNAYAGAAKFKVLDGRSGAVQASNEISFEIRNGAIPLIFNENFFVPLARGQWWEINLNDSRPLRKATKIEVRLTQNRKVVTTETTDFSRLRFQIPNAFRPGKMTVETRTWIGGDVSEWSKPLAFPIAAKPARPSFCCMEAIPPKAEAMFKQNDRVIAVVPVEFGVAPHAAYPENIKRGNLEIFTRYWDENQFTEWKRVAKFDDFDLASNFLNYRSDYDKVKSYSLNAFLGERLYFENNSSEFFTVKRGNNLVVYGDFYVKSAAELAVLLEDGARRVWLKPSEHELASGLIVGIPQDLPDAAWRFWLIDKKTKIKAPLPVKIRLK